MKVIVFGATGMVGQGVLRECLRDETVDNVLVIGRNSIGQTHPKLHELRRPDIFDFGGVAVELQGYNACFFCLGVSAAGMNQTEYTRLTYDLTLGWAKVLARINPAMTFIYVSGAGTGGKAMWAQVRSGPRTGCSPFSRMLICFVSARCAPCMAKSRRRVGPEFSTRSFGHFGP